MAISDTELVFRVKQSIHGMLEWIEEENNHEFMKGDIAAVIRAVLITFTDDEHTVDIIPR